ncbi:MAG: hypothetical protein CMI01_00605 [Oceanospirillaceae bacterium]|nr:hypothetical protein [Oceanospirillaceae bacterium]
MSDVHSHRATDSRVRGRLGPFELWTRGPRRLRNRIFAAWLISLLVALGSGWLAMSLGWTGLSWQLGATHWYLSFYPPVLIAMGWLLWFGFSWAAVLAWVTGWVLSSLGGMPVGDAAFYALIDPAGVAVFALVYYAVPQTADLRIWPNLVLFVVLLFAAAIYSSLGAFYWAQSVSVAPTDLLRVWQGWWQGYLLQGLLVLLPLVLLLDRSFRRWQARTGLWSLQLPRSASFSRITAPVVVLLSAFLLFTYLSVDLIDGILMVASLSREPAVWQPLSAASRDAIGALFWVVILILLAVAVFGIAVFRYWTRRLQRSRRALLEINEALREEVQRREAVQAELYREATIDPLTGLYNRRFMRSWLEKELARERRHDETLAMLMIDIDHFKKLNDHYGHSAGDSALTQLCTFLQENVRESDIACRFGGEELVLLMGDVDPPSAHRRAVDLLEGVRELEISHDGERLPSLTVSIGLALSPRDGTDFDSLIQSADDAMYKAKRSGRDQLCVAGSDNE